MNGMNGHEDALELKVLVNCSKGRIWMLWIKVD